MENLKWSSMKNLKWDKIDGVYILEIGDYAKLYLMRISEKDTTTKDGESCMYKLDVFDEYRGATYTNHFMCDNDEIAKISAVDTMLRHLGKQYYEIGKLMDSLQVLQNKQHLQNLE